MPYDLNASFSCQTFSVYCYFLVCHFQVLHFQSTQPGQYFCLTVFAKYIPAKVYHNWTTWGKFIHYYYNKYSVTFLPYSLYADYVILSASKNKEIKQHALIPSARSLRCRTCQMNYEKLHSQVSRLSDTAEVGQSINCTNESVLHGKERIYMPRKIINNNTENNAI